MSTPQNLAEIEALKNVTAKYSRFGDTQNWTEFRKLFTDDLVYSVEAMPRPNPEAPQAATIEGLNAFIGGMAEMLVGVQTSHQMFLPEITLISPDTAKSTWGIHDLVKTRYCIFNGYGHIHQDYRKVDGEWKITRSHTSRLFVDEQWL
jgi:SnoaL-like domain